MVQNYISELRQLLESGNIELCFGNEDEAAKLLRGEQEATPKAALQFLSRHCSWVVVTIESKGCIAKHDKEVTFMPYVMKKGLGRHSNRNKHRLSRSLHKT